MEPSYKSNNTPAFSIVLASSGEASVQKSIALFLAGAGSMALGFLLYERLRPDTPDPTPVTVFTGDVPVVFRTNGGLLEVAQVAFTEGFTKTQKGTLFGIEIPNCDTEAGLTVRAHITYRVRLAPEWKAKITADKRVLIVAPPLEPAIPVAIDTATLRERVHGCPVIKDARLLTKLRKAISAELAVRAKHPDYKAIARPKAVKTVQEFIRKWYLSDGKYAYAKGYPIVVMFKGDPIEELM
jgi:hypothetical protein